MLHQVSLTVFCDQQAGCILNILICLMLTLKIIHNQHHSTRIQASTILHHAHPISRFFTLLLLLLITYVFSVAFVQFSRDTPLERDIFGSMGASVLGKSLLMGVNCIICPCFFKDKFLCFRVWCIGKPKKKSYHEKHE